MTDSTQMHPNDRKNQAQNLGLSLEDFDRLIDSANKAYEILTENGPFYGREEIKEPTFRVTAQPVKLPEGSKEILETLGNDLIKLASALKKLPNDLTQKLGEELDFTTPPTWRVDAIIDENDNLKINEVEGQDGASALMIAEQLAYGLQKLEDSTAAKLIETIKKTTQKNKDDVYKIAFIRVDNPHNANAERFVKYINDLSKGEVHWDHIFDHHLREKTKNPDWNTYSAIISESSLSPKELQDLKIPKQKILSTGNYNAIVNKGVFALLFDDGLVNFWQEHLDESLERLKKLFIPSKYIETKKDLKEARDKGKVVKASWAGANTSLINRSRGVALPEGDIEQSSEDRWKTLEDLLEQGVKLITQDYIRPKKIKAYLRKKATNLEPIEWHNRICIKYVADGDPNSETLPKVTLTATEVTLGPDVIPAGRKCTFTAGEF